MRILKFEYHQKHRSKKFSLSQPDLRPAQTILPVMMKCERQGDVSAKYYGLALLMEQAPWKMEVKVSNT
jgi:hypothetical protein